MFLHLAQLVLRNENFREGCVSLQLPSPAFLFLNTTYFKIVSSGKLFEVSR